MELRTRVRFGNDRDVSAVIECDVLDDGQPDSIARPVPAAGNPIEALEDPFPVFRRDAAAVIADEEIDLLSLRRDGGDFDPFRSAVQNRIGDQAVQRLLEQEKITRKFDGGPLSDDQIDSCLLYTSPSPRDLG